MAVDSNNEAYQIGIASGGPIVEPICGSVTIPNFHTKVSYYFDWINSYINNEEAPENTVSAPDFIENANQSIDVPEDENEAGLEDERVEDTEICDESESVFKNCGDSGSMNLLWLAVLGALCLRRRFS